MRHLHQHSLLDGANSLASYNNIITSTLHRRSISVSSLFGSLGRQQQQQQEKQHRLQHNNNHQQLHREQQQQSFHYSSDDLESVVDSISTARSYSLHYNILHHQHRCQSSLRPRATDMHVMNCEDEEIENADRLLVQAQEEQQLRTLAAEIIFQPEFYGRDKQLLNDDDHNSLYSTLNPPNNNYYKYNGPVLLDLDVNADDDAIGGGSDENVKVILDEDTTLITENTSTFMMIGETESVNSSTEILKPDIPLLIVSDVSVVNTDSRDEGFITRNSTCSQPHPTTASSVNDQPASQSSPAESVSLNSPSPSPSPSPLLPILLPSSFDQNAPATLRTTKTTWGRVKKTLNHARRQSISSIHSILPASLLRKKREDVGNSGTQGGEDESIGLESTQVQINTPPPLSTLQPPIISFNKRRSVMSISSLIGKYIDYSSDDEDEEDGSTRSGKELSEMVTSPTLALDHQSTIDSGRKSIRKFSDIGRRFSRSISSASLTAATNSSSSRQINIAPPPTSSSKKWSFVSFSNYKSTVSPQSTPVIETGTSSSTALPLDDDHKSPKFYTYHLESTTDETLPPASTTTATTTIPIISRRVLSDRQLDRIAKRMSTATMNGDVTVLDVELRDMYLKYLSSPLAILDDDHLLRKKEEDEHLLSRRSQQINNHRRQQQNVPHLDMKFGFEQIEEENEEEEKVQL